MAAMQIILFAGNSRNLVNEALSYIEKEGNIERANEKIREAKIEITKAHKIQTDVIQETIEEEEMKSTLLFSHAQDTLMTIYSELNLAKHLIKIYSRIISEVKG